MASSPSAARPPGPAALVFAGTGLFLFGASLAAGMWLYAVKLADATIAGPTWAVPANVALFTAFAGHHSVMARTRAKAWLVRFVPPCLERASYVWVASLLFLATCLSWQPVAGVVWQTDGPLTWVCRALQLAGLGLTLASALLLDVLDLGGVRQVLRARRGLPPSDPDSGAGLSWRGPFGWVRHPIYLGWLLMTLPAPTMTAGWFVFAVVSSLYLAVAIPWEERSLERQHGESYRAYQRTVRWRMIPFVY